MISGNRPNSSIATTGGTDRVFSYKTNAVLMTGRNGNQIDHLFFYIPEIPDIETTGRYNQAIELTSHATTSELLTEQTPPPAVRDQYDEIHLLEGGNIVRSQRARRLVDKRFNGEKTDQQLFVTTFHYAPALAGASSDAFWAVTRYDDPTQYAHNAPRSHHQVTARILERLLRRADRQVYTVTPTQIPPQHAEIRFVRNGLGCPIEHVTPGNKLTDDTLRAVWAGSPRLDRGIDILIDALTRVDEEIIHVDVYGDEESEVRRLAEQKGVTDKLTFHGRQSHEEVCAAIGNAEIGLCVLPERADWLHTPSLKAREYLAGGTIPVVSNFPGFRSLARDHAVYSKPDGKSLAAVLNQLGHLSSDRLETIFSDIRAYAETIPMKKERRWWAQQIVGHTGLSLSSTSTV